VVPAAFVSHHDNSDTIIVTISVSRCQAEAADDDSTPILMDKMLYNIGLDIAGTDMVLVTPKNMSFHRYQGIGSVEEVVMEEYRTLDELRLQMGKRWQRQPTAMLLSTFTTFPSSILSASALQGEVVCSVVFVVSIQDLWLNCFIFGY
jgi:hypothetical protein